MTESREAALHETEQSVKSVRNEQAQPQQNRDQGGMRKLFNTARVSKAGAGGLSTKPNHPTPLSDADIRAAMNLVDESWGRQLYRLQQYLQRNYNFANNVPTAMDVGDEEFERPWSGGSLTKLIERVKIDSTPTFELDSNRGFFDATENEPAQETSIPAEESEVRGISSDRAENTAP